MKYGFASCARGGAVLAGAQIRAVNTLTTRNVRLDRGLGEQDQRQVLALSWVWAPHLFGGATGLGRILLDGWAVNGITSFYGGQPLRMRSGRDNDFDSYPNGDRPDVVGDWKLSPDRSRDEVILAWFNPRAFAANQPGQLGNLSGNVVIGPGFKGVDLGGFEELPDPRGASGPVPGRGVQRLQLGEPGRSGSQLGLKYVF